MRWVVGARARGDRAAAALRAARRRRRPLQHRARSWPTSLSTTRGSSRATRTSRNRLGLMAYEFKLPDLGEGLTEGEVARWLVAEGQEIAEDDPLVEIQTDKTTVEIPSPAAGRSRASSSRKARSPRSGPCSSSSGTGRRRFPTLTRRTAIGASRRGSVATPIALRQEARAAHAARPPDRPGARRRPRHGRRRPGPAGGSPRRTCARGPPVRRPSGRACPEATARAAPRRAPPHRRAPDDGPPRDPRRDVRRGVRLHGRRPQAPRPD